MIVTFYGSYDKLLGRRTLSSVTPEAAYELPAAEAPDGKLFNGWMLTCGDAQPALVRRTHTVQLQ